MTVDKLVLQKQLEDYTKLVDNEFWHRFLEYVAEEAQQKLKECGKEEYTDMKLRYWQGAHKALKKVYEEYPDRLLKEIRQEIDK